MGSDTEFDALDASVQRLFGSIDAHIAGDTNAHIIKRMKSIYAFSCSLVPMLPYVVIDLLRRKRLPTAAKISFLVGPLMQIVCMFFPGPIRLLPFRDTYCNRILELSILGPFLQQILEFFVESQRPVCVYFEYGMTVGYIVLWLGFFVGVCVLLVCKLLSFLFGPCHACLVFNHYVGDSIV